MLKYRSFDKNIEIGILAETFFVKSLEKLKFITDNYEIEHLPLSGRNSGFMYDVLLTCINDNYRNIAFDVKGVGANLPPRVFISTRGMQYNKQVRNAISQGYTPFLAFYKKDITENMAQYPNNWYIYHLNYYSWLCRLNSYPSYHKLVKKSIILKELPEYIQNRYCRIIGI